MKILKWLDEHFEESILIAILSSIVIVMLYQIVRRYVFNSSLTWSEEYCRYAFTWFMFIGVAYSVRLGSELRMDAVVNMFPEKIKEITLFGVLLFSLAFSIFLFIQSFATVRDAVTAGEISSGMHLPKQYVTMSMTFGMGLTAARYFQVLYKKIRSRREKKS